MFESSIGVVFMGKDTALCDQLFECADRNVFTILSTITSGHLPESHIKSLCPDAIILDESYPSKGLPFTIARLRSIASFRPVIMVTSKAADPGIVELCAEAGADYYMVKPFMAEALWDRLSMLNEDRGRRPYKCRGSGAQPREKMVVRLLYNYGIGPNTKGFTYIKDAALLLTGWAGSGRDRFSEIYRILGKKYGQSPANIKRNIDHALRAARLGETSAEFISFAACAVSGEDRSVRV